MVGNTFDFFDTYDYDHLNRLTDLFQFAAPFVSPTNTVAQKSAEFEYNQLGQFTRIERFGGNYDENPNVVSAYTYDHANRLTGLVDTLPDESSTVMASYGWTYDRANRVNSFTNAVHTNESLTYSYDAAGQLTGYANAGYPSYSGDYSYDSNGNRTSTATTLAGFGTVTHSYTNGVLNQTLSDGQYQYTYDGLGNMTQKVKLDSSDNATGETTVYAWDWRNRLTTVTDYASYSTLTSSGTPTWKVTYVYDAFNQMVGRKEYHSGGTTPTKSEHFIYDNGQIVLKLADDGSVYQRYLWAPAVDMLLAQEDGSTNDILWALGDNLNTIRDWVDDSGAVVAHRSYDPFGVAQAFFSSGTVDSSFAWTAKFRDERTGLQYNQHGDGGGRWYAPELGKWMSRDEIGFRGDPSNLYRYAENGPTNGSDPSGHVKIHYIPGRVTASFPAFFRVTGKESLEIESDFQAQWKVNGAAFVTGNGCKRCDEIGIIQIVKGRGQVTPFNPPPAFLRLNYPWEVDSDDADIAYSKAGPVGPVRGDPTVTPIISMVDNPIFTIGGIYSVVNYRLDFETYVVCLKGREGIKLGARSLGFGEVLTYPTDITVYAGVSWYTEFSTRAPKSSPPYYSTRTIVSQPAIPGENFSLAVDKWFTRSTFSGFRP